MNKLNLVKLVKIIETLYKNENMLMIFLKSFLILFLESHRFCNRVQDAYTLRCCPQVHGIVHDTIDFVRGIITTEMNSATDNPVGSFLIILWAI